MVAVNTLLLLGIAIFSIVLFYIYFNDKNKGRKHPPGPRGLPFVGNLFSLGSKPHLVLTKWAKKYGPIFKVQLGRTPTVVINDIKLIREVFNEQVFSGRPDNKALDILSGSKNGILFSDGDDWVEQRRFTLRNLRDFGFGKKSMEDMIMEEVIEVNNWLKKCIGKPISLNRKFSLAALNSLWTIMTSEHYNHDDPKINKILDTMIESLKETTERGGSFFFFPELAEHFPGISGWNAMIKAAKPLKNLFSTAVQDRLKDPVDPNNPRDFMDAYINEINKTVDPKSSFYKETGLKSLTAVIGDLHGAGSETTATTLLWAILYLMKFPKIQNKLRQEIEDTVGKTRLISLADKPNMPYTGAVMMETLRISSIVPMGLFHNTMADTNFHGYFIPKNTMIILNHYLAHHNIETWIDPENFRPERFLSPDGKSIIKHESLIPFGTGKRACIGKTLARDEFFLFLTNIIHQFQINPDPTNPACLEADAGFLAIPKVFTVIIKDILK